ncbi:hypothetical protein C0993_001578 [Termitomyces sp. T159_Od127]|nr:hypothetical protein C0993_001578 [Termitomyces sp. T159_Od127]
MSSKHRLSLEDQGPAKRRNQDSGSPAASPVEAAEQLLRRARRGQTYQQLCSLASSGAPSQELEACYTPIFKELAQIIAGRANIPVPPAQKHRMLFMILLDPECESSIWRKVLAKDAMQDLIDYITAEDKKRPREVFAPGPKVLKAVQSAWKTDYVGDHHELLREAMNNMYKHSAMKPYGNFCAIIQGSGTGKSRLVDKLSESVFAIPIILRPDEDKSGFPLGDIANGNSLLNFFCGFKLERALYVQRRYLLFLLKTIAFADKWIDGQETLRHGTEPLCEEWRNYIGLPQSKERTAMYTAAIDMSPTLKEFKDILDENVQFNTVQNEVQKFVKAFSQKIKPAGTFGPAFIFYFDEAHHLNETTVTPHGASKRTAYQCLCKALTYMTSTPVFSFFLSTYSRLSEFTPRARTFWSSRPESNESKESDDNMNAPFVELPFDTWKNSILVTEGSHSSQQICSLKFMVRFGRPLKLMAYAMKKLELRLEDSTWDKLHDYPFKELIPALAVRVDLAFEPNRDEAVLLEGLLVSSSMRTVYSVPQHRQYLRGGYPSEPFLAEAAARALLKKCRIKALGPHGNMQQEETEDIIDKIMEIYKADIPSAILAWLEKGLIDKGQRGELFARVLCTLAHDISILKKTHDYQVFNDEVSFSQMIPVVDFLHALISEEYVDIILKVRPKNTHGKTLEEAFKDGFVHFTQFVKAGDKLTITDESAYLLFVRAAAIQGYGNLNQADLLIPVWIRRHENDKPDRWSMTAIFIQVKNRINKVFTFIDAQETFKFFSPAQGHEERPYITITMDLGISASQEKSTQEPEAKNESRNTPEQKSAQEPKAKGKGRNQTHMPATPFKRYLSPEVAVLPVRADPCLTNPSTTLELERKLRKRPRAHPYPRYEISIMGCSKNVYNVVDRVSYSSLLVHKDMLAEHPRHGKYLDAIRRMKPYWVAESSYYWAEMKKGSRLGAHVIKEQDAEELVSDGGR